MSANDSMLQVWNTVLFERFSRYRFNVTEGMARHSDRYFERRPYPAGARVLDVGSGFGDTAQRIAREVGPRGEVVGVDLAPNFVELANREAREAGLGNLSFFAADAQTDDLRGPYDFLFSRHGTMFFSDPVAAFANMRRALRPGGGLAMVVWRRREDNPWVHKAELRIKQMFPPPAPANAPAPAAYSPGPFALANADAVSEILRAAGFDRIAFERCDVEACLGRTMDDAVEYGQIFGPAAEALRLAGDAVEARRGEVVAALREIYAEHLRPDGVWMMSSSWLVTARNSGGLGMTG